MKNPEKSHIPIQNGKIEKFGRDANYVREKLNRLGIAADNENIDAFAKLVSIGSVTAAMLKEASDNKNPEIIAKKIDRYKKWEKIAKDAGLTNDEAVVAVKFLGEIKSRFKPEARGEKPRDYIESFKGILREYNITLTLSDMNSLNNFPIRNFSIKKENEIKIENKVKTAELKENMEKLVEQGIISTDSLFEKLTEIYKEDKDKNWIKYLVQKNIKKKEILDEYLKSYVKEPATYFLKHHTIERIEKRPI